MILETLRECGRRCAQPSYQQRVNLYGGRFFAAVEKLRHKANDKTQLKRAVFFGVKNFVMTGWGEDRECVAYKLNMAGCINELYLARLTPTELTQIFPVDKFYKGERNYFTTMALLRELGMDKPIGEKNALPLLLGYENDDIVDYVATFFYVLDTKVARLGRPSILPVVSKLSGMEFTWTHTDKNGRTYATDVRTGETKRLRRRAPKYMKAIQGGVKQ